MKRPFSFLKRPARADAAPPEPRLPDLPRPGRHAYVIGDVHGRADLLEPLIDLIDDDIAAIGATDPELVFVGNYIDLGPDSPGALDRLRNLTTDFPKHVTCLMGSHERMLLDFLADPSRRAARWIKAGGDGTLAAFGVSAAEPDAEAMAAALLAALPHGLHDWLLARPLLWQSGNVWAVHAGADPYYPMASQKPRVLLWGHPEFDSSDRGDGQWIVHGHRAVDAPRVQGNRIAVDTGAWQTGRLTACALRPDGSHRFLATGTPFVPEGD